MSIPKGICRNLSPFLPWSSSVYLYRVCMAFSLPWEQGDLDPIICSLKVAGHSWGQEREGRRDQRAQRERIALLRKQSFVLIFTFKWLMVAQAQQNQNSVPFLLTSFISALEISWYSSHSHTAFYLGPPQACISYPTWREHHSDNLSQTHLSLLRF